MYLHRLWNWCEKVQNLGYCGWKSFLWHECYFHRSLFFFDGDVAKIGSKEINGSSTNQNRETQNRK
jgi:hypothetical protein